MVFGVAGSQGGLGWFIYQNRFEMNTGFVFAGLLTVILIGTSSSGGSSGGPCSAGGRRRPRFFGS